MKKTIYLFFVTLMLISISAKAQVTNTVTFVADMSVLIADGFDAAFIRGGLDMVRLLRSDKPSDAETGNGQEKSKQQEDTHKGKIREQHRPP